MAYKKLRKEDISILRTEVEGDIAIAYFSFPGGTLEVIANCEILEGAENRTAVRLEKLHIQSGTLRPNALGIAALRALIDYAMDLGEIDEIIIAGGTRTTRAGPGRRPRQLRFARGSSDPGERSE